MKNITSLTVNRLFFRRWRDRLRLQLGVLRSTFDLTILLYIGIPGLLLGGRAYYGLWRDELPAWLVSLPFAAVPALLLFLVYSLGGLSLYIEAADVLFLRQRPRWIKGLMLRGWRLSMARQAAVLCAVFAVLSPLLVRVYGMSGTAIAAWIAVTYGLKAVQMLLANLLGVLTTGWRRIIYSWLSYGLLSAVFLVWASAAGAAVGAASFLLAVLAAAMLAAALARWRFRLKGRFDAEVREEERQKTKLIALLLASAIDKPKAPKPGARPWLFRRWRRLLPSRSPEARVAEALVKAFFRGSELKLYGQLILAGLAALVIPPYPVNAIVYIVLIFVLMYWLSGHLRAFFARDGMQMLNPGEMLEYRTAVPAMTLLLLPGLVCFTAGLGVTLYPPLWGGLGAIPCGVLLAIVLGGFYGKIGILLLRRS
ncbi:ABC transporter permease [Paenibacillus sp. TH7-28]